MSSDFQTWSEFNDTVLGLLPLDKSRLIQGDDDNTYIRKLIRLAVIDLQDFIEAYRKGHETIYLPTDFVTEGRASRAVLPPQAVVRDCWLFKEVESGELSVESKTGKTCNKPERKRHPVLRHYPWEKRFHLTGDLALPHLHDGLVDWPYIVQNVPLPTGAFEHRGERHGLMSCDPYGYTFYVYPEVKEGWLFSLFWDGLKLDFQDGEQTPFNERTAQAVSEFVRGKLARDVDHDLATYESYFRADPRNPGSYVLTRKNLWRSEKERTSL